MSANRASLAIAAALLLGAGAVGALAAAHGGAPKQGAASLHVSGHIAGLYPGASRQMRVRVRNGSDHPVRLRLVRARVQSASPFCRRSNLIVRRSRRRLRIPAYRNRWIRLRVTMPSTAPDGCQGATFRLRFRAVGRPLP
jgi:hypothetical protein